MVNLILVGVSGLSGCSIFFIFSFQFYLGLITEDALILQENEKSDADIFFLKPDNTTFDASKSSSQRGMNISNAKNKSTCEKVNMCEEQGNYHGSEMLWKALLSNRDHIVTQDSKENLPPPQPLTSKTCPLITAIPPSTSSLGSLGSHTSLHLDMSSPLSPPPLNVLKSQVEPMSPLCRQAMECPTEMKSVGKESQKQIDHNEEKLTPRMFHRLSSGLLKAPVKDTPLVAPETIVENTECGKSVTRNNTAISVPTVDEPNPVDPGIVLFR